MCRNVINPTLQHTSLIALDKANSNFPVKQCQVLRAMECNNIFYDAKGVIHQYKTGKVGDTHV
jgi:hypothetical protein